MCSVWPANDVNGDAGVKNYGPKQWWFVITCTWSQLDAGPKQHWTMVIYDQLATDWDYVLSLTSEWRHYGPKQWRLCFVMNGEQSLISGTIATTCMLDYIIKGPCQGRSKVRVSLMYCWLYNDNVLIRVTRQLSGKVAGTLAPNPSMSAEIRSIFPEIRSNTAGFCHIWWFLVKSGLKNRGPRPYRDLGPPANNGGVN